MERVANLENSVIVHVVHVVGNFSSILSITFDIYDNYNPDCPGSIVKLWSGCCKEVV